MRIGLILAGTALIAFLPATPLSAQSFDGPHPRGHVGGRQTDVANPDIELGTWTLDADRTARAGYLLDPTTLAYVRGGYANARIETSASSALSQLSELEYRDSWTLGAGIERQILKRISARLEYRYVDLSEGDGPFDRHRLIAGIAYRF